MNSSEGLKERICD